MVQIIVIIALLVVVLLFLKKSGFFDYLKKLYVVVKEVFAEVWLVAKEVFTAFVDFVGSLFAFVSAIFDPEGDAMAAAWTVALKAWKLFKTVAELAWVVVLGFLEIAGMALFAFGEAMWEKIQEKVGGSFAAVLLSIVVVGALIAGTIMLAAITGPYLVFGLFAALILGIIKNKFFAEGGITTGGMSIVGEKGPEIINLPSGTRVHSNAASQSMLSGSSTNNITVNVQGRIGASDSELRDIASKVGRMISTEINRSTSSGTRV